MTDDIHREYGKGKSEMVKKKTLKMGRERTRDTQLSDIK